MSRKAHVRNGREAKLRRQIAAEERAAEWESLTPKERAERRYLNAVKHNIVTQHRRDYSHRLGLG